MAPVCSHTTGCTSVSDFAALSRHTDTVVGILIGFGTVLVAERILESDRFAVPDMPKEKA